MRRKLILFASIFILLLYFVQFNLFSPKDLVVFLSLKKASKENNICDKNASTLIVMNTALLAQFSASDIEVVDLQNLGAVVDSGLDINYLIFGYWEENFDFLHRKLRKIDKTTIRVVVRNIIIDTPYIRILISPIKIHQDYWYMQSINELNLSALAILTPHDFSRKSATFLNESFELLVPEPSHQIIKDLKASRFIECRRDLAQRTEQLYKTKFNIGISVINASVVDDMAYLRDKLRTIDMTILLHSGSLLGWYRECGIIPHTTDIDLSFPSAEYNPKMDDVIRNDKRLKAYWRLGYPHDGLEYSTYAGPAKIDVFGLYYDEKSNESWIGGMIVDKKEKIKFVYPGAVVLCSADLLGRLFHVPCDVERFLVADYGDNWSYPHLTSDYVWDKSPKSLRRVGKFTDEEWPKVFKVFQ
uniref:Uncharacterized protein n=1 Tax=Romanomermis culicivorax TaxID=13658 RepID=A0A915IX81_ROMCU